MAKHTIARDEVNRGLILHIEERVTSGDWEALRQACLGALETECIVLNLERVSEYDFSLSLFVCLLRRTVGFLGMRLTIRGSQEEFRCLHTDGALCSEATSGCLCRNLFSPSHRTHEI